jgi:hypothetical protein
LTWGFYDSVPGDKASCHHGNIVLFLFNDKVGKMTREKKEWERPRLIVLGRGRPEESVLLACKAAHNVCGQGFNKSNAIVAPS